MIRKILFVLAIMLSFTSARAQFLDTVRGMYWGALFEESLFQHDANFQRLPGVPNCCPRFESGDGLGPALGVMFEKDLASQFRGGLAVKWESRTGTLTSRETKTVNIDGVGTPAEIDHEIIMDASALSLVPSVSYGVLADFRVGLGLGVSYYLSPQYRQREILVTPTDRGTFENGRRERNTLDGDLPEANQLGFELQGLLEYELPLNTDRSLRLVPRLAYAYGISQVVNDLEWKANALRPGISVKYFLAPAPEPIEVVPEPEVPVIVEVPDVTPPAPPAFSADLSVFALSADGVRREVAGIQREEFHHTAVMPLLPYLFFDRGSSTIPSRYQSRASATTSAFASSQLDASRTLESYYQILNILGERLTTYPTAQLTIVGATDGSEEGGLELARARAEAARDYLKDVWSLNTKRLRVVARLSPERASSGRTEEGAEENRRVEFTSKNPRILAPLFTRDTLVTTDPPQVIVVPRVEAEAGVKRASLVMSNRADQVVNTRDESTVPAEWRIGLSDLSTASQDTLTIAFTARDNHDQQITRVRTLPVETRTLAIKRSGAFEDAELEEYRLILFDFGTTAPTGENRRVAERIRERLKPNSKVRVDGFTDKIGDEANNRRLALLRAQATAATLGRPDAQVRGIGEDELIFDNSLPEGRLYSRTVRIQIETPTR